MVIRVEKGDGERQGKIKKGFSTSILEGGCSRKPFYRGPDSRYSFRVEGHRVHCDYSAMVVDSRP